MFDTVCEYVIAGKELYIFIGVLVVIVFTQGLLQLWKIVLAVKFFI